MMPLDHLPAWEQDTGRLLVAIETPRGSRNKYKYEPKYAQILLDKVLPPGAVFPYDFGFIPSTRGEDGDPLDVLLLMDEPGYPGCCVRGRLVGVIEAEQTEGDETTRNDRLIAVASRGYDYAGVQTLAAL